MYEAAHAESSLAAGDVPTAKVHLRRGIAMLKNAGFTAPKGAASGTKGIRHAMVSANNAAEDLFYVQCQNAIKNLTKALFQLG